MNLISFSQMIDVDVDTDALEILLARLYGIEFGDQDGQYHLCVDTDISVIETDTASSQTAVFEMRQSNCMIDDITDFINVCVANELVKHHPSIDIYRNGNQYKLIKGTGDSKKYYRLIIGIGLNARKNWVG